MTEAVSAKGTHLYVSTDSGSTYSEFLEVSATPEIGTTASTIDVTHLNSEVKEYINDIPDWASSTLDFTMNAMPTGSTSANLDLVQTLEQGKTYAFKVVWEQLKKQVTFSGQVTWRIGAGAVSSKQDLIVSITPKSAPVFADYTATASVTTE